MTAPGFEISSSFGRGLRLRVRCRVASGFTGGRCRSGRKVSSGGQLPKTKAIRQRKRKRASGWPGSFRSANRVDTLVLTLNLLS